jgi:hypothetical protein
MNLHKLLVFTFALFSFTELRAAPRMSPPPFAIVHGDPEVYVPQIAEIGGIRVGVNGRERLERIMGAGVYSISGHSNGRESWYVRHPASVISTDGFEHNREGEVVTSFEWTLDSSSPKNRNSGALPVARRLHSKPGWLGVILPGMERKQVLALLPRILLPVKSNAMKWEYNHAGFVRPSALNYDVYTQWSATLTFTRDTLTEISVSCEGHDLAPGTRPAK